MSDIIRDFRVALYDTFNLTLIRQGKKGMMVGKQPWADLYNYLATIHSEK